MLKFKKYISIALIISLLCSLLPMDVMATNDSGGTPKVENVQEPVVNERMKEVVQERTVDSKTFTDGSGTFVKEIYPEEIHYKVGDEYQEISEELVKKETKGYVESEATKLESSFPEQPEAGKPFIYRSGQHELLFELTGASDGKDQIQPNEASTSEQDGNAYTYKEVYPDIDLRHIVLNNEVKEDWIMHEYNGIHEFSYTIQTSLYGEVEKDGSVAFYENEKKEERVFELPKPVMVDSNYNDTLGDGVRSTKLHYELTKTEDNQYELVLKVDQDWLASSKRIFPIYIDPSVSIETLGDSFVMSAYPNNNYNNEWDPSQGEYVLKTGYYDSTTGTNYAFVKFSVANAMKGAVIDSAKLSAYVTHSYYADTKTGLWVDEVKKPWVLKEITWNNKPSSTNIAKTTVARDEWAHFDVTDTIQAWSDETRGNYGFKFHTNGNGKTHWKKITASQSTKKTKLSIEYHYEKMKTPTVNAYSNGEGKADGYIDVKWKSIYGAKSYELQMYDGKSYQTVYTGSGTSWTSKDKKMFPKAPYTTSSVYLTDGKGVELPNDPSAFYSKKSGTTTTAKEYKFRVLASFSSGNSPVSSVVSKAIPVIELGAMTYPKVKGFAYTAKEMKEDPSKKDRGWLDISWDAYPNAIGYKVLIYNGKNYEIFEVGKNVTEVSTKGKHIWPTDAEIAAGSNRLHITDLSSTTSVAKGAELPLEPGPTYGSSSKRYNIRIKAVTAAGDTPISEANYGYIPLSAPEKVTVTGDIADYVLNKGKLHIKWDEVKGAGGYQVKINTGEEWKTFTVKGETSFHTKGKTIFPNFEDLPIDPTNYYGANAPEELKKKKAYEVQVHAFRFDDDDEVPATETEKLSGPRAFSHASETAEGRIPAQEELLGYEDYFTYGDHQTGNAQTSVNVTTGNMLVEFTDHSLFTRGLVGFDFTRYYNSRSERVSALGKGWTFAGNENLVKDGKNIFYYDEDGTKHTFLYNEETGKYTSPKGKYLTLTPGTVNGTDGFTIKDRDRFTKQFELNSGNENEYRLYAYKDVHDNTIRFFYNANHQLEEISEVNKAGEKIRTSITLTYNTEGFLDVVKYDKRSVAFTYNKNQLESTETKYSGVSGHIVEVFLYNELGQLNSYVDGQRNITEYQYGTNELIVYDQRAPDAGISVSTKYQFNHVDNIYIVTDTEGFETTYQRDDDKETFAVKNIENSNDTTSSYTYDDQYNVTESIDEEGIVRTNTYDSNGNLLTMTDVNGTTSYAYDDKNRISKLTEPLGKPTIYNYEGENLKSAQVGEEEDEEKEVTQYEYDEYGREKKVLYPNDTFTETIYDDENNKITVRDKKGQETSTTHDIYGNVIRKTDADGRSISYEYHPLNPNLITAVKEGKAENVRGTHYTYDNNGNMTTLKDALERIKKYEYNQNDQVTNVTFPKDKSNNEYMNFEYKYNSNGNVEYDIKPSGNKLYYVYNEMDEVAKVSASTSSGNDVVEWGYQYSDETGQLEKIIFKDSQTQDELIEKNFGYNPETALLNLYIQGAYKIDYEYDENERPKKTTYSYTSESPWTVEQSVVYKEDGKLDNRIVGLGKQSWMSFAYGYNLDNNKQTVTVNDGLYERTTAFNDGNQLESILYAGSSNLKFSYEHDGSGNIKKIGNNQKTTNYEYDDYSQLEKEILPDSTVYSYEYDKVGNRKSKSINGNKTDEFTYNDANQITQKNNIAYEYDADGNLIQDENYKYEYNILGHQTKVTNLQGNIIAEYEYDESGLRTKKIIGEKTHEYYYNDTQLSLEIIRNGNSIEQYRYYEWDGYTPLGMVIREKGENDKWKENIYHYWTNHRGDVVSIQDNERNEVGSYVYDAYGNMLEVDGELAEENPIRYAGYYYDEETKNYYLKARYYNPENGAFLALDPHSGDIDDPISQNGYTYANNNPVLNIDPTGENAKRMLYAVTTGLAFILQGLTNDLRATITTLGTLFSLVTGYKDFQKAKKASDTELAKKIVKSSRYMKKYLIKDAKKALAKHGLKIAAKSLGIGWGTVADYFAKGVYYGWSKKYYNNGLCQAWGRNSLEYAKYVAKKQLK